jgi:hypothetical protein
MYCFWVSVFLGQSKVDKIHTIAIASDSHQKIVWFHITMNKFLTVNILQTSNLNSSNQKENNNNNSSVQQENNNNNNKLNILNKKTKWIDQFLRVKILKKLWWREISTSWSASMRTVLRLNLRLQKLKRSSRLGPNNSITITLKSPSILKYRTYGIPTEKKIH